MKMFSQIMPDEAAGRVVRQIYFEDHELAVAFEDDTFVYFKLGGGWEGETNDIETEIEHPDQFCSRFGVAAGIYDRETFEDRQRIVAEMNKNAQDQRDRAEFERLKQRFGGPPGEK